MLIPSHFRQPNWLKWQSSGLPTTVKEKIISTPMMSIALLLWMLEPKRNYDMPVESLSTISSPRVMISKIQEC